VILPSASRLRLEPYIWNQTRVSSSIHCSVCTEPAVVRAVNQRLAAQPYKAMIYPYRDPETGEFVPNSYLIGWEYSTNGDFQDAVCRVENVELVVEPRP